MKVDKNLEQLAKFQPLFSRKRFCAVPPPISISPLMYLLSQRRGQRVANERWKVVARSRRQKSWQWPTTSAHLYLFLLGPPFSIACENRKRNSLIGHVLKDTRSSLGGTLVYETTRVIRLTIVGEDKQEHKERPTMWYLYMLLLWSSLEYNIKHMYICEPS